jgi:hypothetical protein
LGERRINNAAQRPQKLFCAVYDLGELGRGDLIGALRVVIGFFDTDDYNASVGVRERDDLLRDVITSDAANAGLIPDPTIRLTIARWQSTLELQANTFFGVAGRKGLNVDKADILNQR